MQGVERPHRHRKWLQCPAEHRRRELEEGNTTDQSTCLLAVRLAETARVEPVPHLVFEQTAGYQRLLPQRLGRYAVLGQQLGERHRAVEVDHRSSRSCCSSRIRSSNGPTGLRGGGGPPASVGGVSHPSRTASASSASASKGLRPARGGTISATT